MLWYRYTINQYAHNVFEYGLELAVAMKDYFQSFQPHPVTVSTQEELSRFVALRERSVGDSFLGVLMQSAFVCM